MLAAFDIRRGISDGTRGRSSGAVRAGAVRDALDTPGAPLDSNLATDMGRRLGHSFRDVRVHNDARAAASAQLLGADAYTVGRDIVFGAGRYVPGSTAGRATVAHELTHVVQQHDSPAGMGGTVTVDASPAAEDEARHVAVGLSATPGDIGQAVGVRAGSVGSPETGIQRQATPRKRAGY